MTPPLRWRAGPVTVDRLRPTDAAVLAAYRDDPVVARFQGWALPFTEDDARRLIAEVAGVPFARPGTAVQLAVRATGDDHLVGDVYVAVDDGQPWVAELGVTVAAAEQGRGYATAAVGLVVDVLAERGVTKVVAYVDAENRASLRLFDRLGFRREGRLAASARGRDGSPRDEVLFGITAEAWRRPGGARRAWSAALAADRSGDPDHRVPSDPTPEDAAVLTLVEPLVAPADIEVIAFDADDTLWHNEDDFHQSQELLKELLAPYVGGSPIDEHLLACERRNLELFGYGVKGFLLSMIETAIQLTDGRVSAGDIHRLIERGKAMIARPVELLDGVTEVLDELRGRYRLVLITLGDLFHQEQKIARSGLAEHFDHVEIVSEKDEATYRRILRRLDVAPERFLMVGNSLRSDILPVLAIGGSAVHVPYTYLWAHQHVDHDREVDVIDSLRALPGWLSARSPQPPAVAGGPTAGATGGASATGR